LFTRFVKGLGNNAAIAWGMLLFLTAAFENGCGHGLVACTIAAIMACLDPHILIFSRGRK
jgi:hypothetical protein